MAGSPPEDKEKDDIRWKLKNQNLRRRSPRNRRSAAGNARMILSTATRPLSRFQGFNRRFQEILTGRQRTGLRPNAFQ